MNDEVPLIWTIKGNLPVDSLKYEHSWEHGEGFIKFSERYLLDGEIVKESAHVYSKFGVTGEAVATSI